MKIKISFIIILSILMVVSFSQIFTIPPYSDDIFEIYRSGYFSELDKEFNIIKDSFIGIKTLGEPVYGWIFLKDIGKEHKISAVVYDRKGLPVFAPGKKGDKVDSEVYKVIQSIDPETTRSISMGKYISIIPMKCGDTCKFCHSNCGHNKVLGAMRFEREYDAHIYYSSERIIIFVCVTIMLGVLMFFLIRWEPGKNVKELFDKNP